MIAQKRAVMAPCLLFDLLIASAIGVGRAISAAAAIRTFSDRDSFPSKCRELLKFKLESDLAA